MPKLLGSIGLTLEAGIKKTKPFLSHQHSKQWPLRIIEAVEIKKVKNLNYAEQLRTEVRSQGCTYKNNKKLVFLAPLYRLQLGSRDKKDETLPFSPA